jgi:hypothetical protein
MDPGISTSPMPFNFTQPDGEMMSIVAIQDQDGLEQSGDLKAFGY